MNWQPIETAPKDGTAILGADQYGMYVVTWTPSLPGDGYWYDGSDWDPKPTHWMPLPEPPQ